jgi:hypothetical protein
MPANWQAKQAQGRQGVLLSSDSDARNTCVCSAESTRAAWSAWKRPRTVLKRCRGSDTAACEDSGSSMGESTRYALSTHRLGGLTWLLCATLAANRLYWL